MELGTRSLVGRSRELAAITDALTAAQRGRGSVWLVTGEPGIGKSRFVEEVARESAEHELTVLWGRAWEAGGAPAYWLFIQVLRALLRIEDPRALLDAHAAATLAELLPELSEVLGPPSRESTPGGLDPNQAHFRVMDAATRVLCAAVRRAPLLIVLEDLHAADPASIAVLGLLAQQARAERLVIVGTYRESDAQRSTSAEALSRIAQTAERLSLDRLSADEARDLLARASGTQISEELSRAVYAATEGNPLYVSELARLHAQQRLTPSAGAPASGLAIPASIKSAIRSRLAALSPRARHLLGLAAVIGREHRIEALEQLAQRTRGDTLEILDEVLSAEIVLEVAPGLLRFSHILLREVAYADLDPAAREAAHAAYAAQLELQTDSRGLSERAHHLLLAGTGAARAAVEASRRAGAYAFKQHAAVEAASWFARALEALQRTEHETLERCALLLDLGEAQLVAHDAAGQATCLQAAAIARQLGDAELFARAALTLGAVFRVAEVSPPLVAALHEALALLPEHDHALRAKVMARLAAAQQPAAEVGLPIAMAWEAIAMARRLGEPETLLEVIRAGCSAMIDLAPPRHSVELCREHIALAERLGNQAEAFRGNMRLSMCAYGAGLVHEALAAVSACQRIADAIAQPHFGWRAAALASMRALWQGRFDEASALRSGARRLAEQAGDPNAFSSLRMQSATQLELQGHFDEAIDELSALERGAPTSRIIAVALGLWGASLYLRAGRRREALERIQGVRGEIRVAMVDMTLTDALVDVAIALDDRELMRELLARDEEHIGENVGGGVFGMTWDLPVRRDVAELRAAFGDWPACKEHYDQMLAELRALGGRSNLVWLLFDHGRACFEHGDAERGAALLAEARALGAELGVRADSLAYQPEGSLPPAIAGGVATDALALKFVREGEYWSIERVGGRAFRLKDGKGLSMLARLIDEPGRELHVLDLAGGASSEPGAVDGGDAGTLLDARARAAYEGRVRELREELAEAERDADIGRAGRLTEELEALTQELARAVGLGGRDRRAASAVERARVNVQRRLRDALDRIREHDPDLGRHLAYTVKTGTYCSYLR